MMWPFETIAHIIRTVFRLPAEEITPSKLEKGSGNGTCILFNHSDLVEN